MQDKLFSQMDMETRKCRIKDVIDSIKSIYKYFKIDSALVDYEKCCVVLVSGLFAITLDLSDYTYDNVLINNGIAFTIMEKEDRTSIKNIKIVSDVLFSEGIISPDIVKLAGKPILCSSALEDEALELVLTNKNFAEGLSRATESRGLVSLTAIADLKFKSTNYTVYKELVRDYYLVFDKDANKFIEDEGLCNSVVAKSRVMGCDDSVQV